MRPRQALSEVSKEFVEIAVYGNSLRNLQQSLVPLRESFTGRCGMRFHGGPVWRNKQSRLKRGEEGAARCPLCSQNAHDQNVLAWVSDASRRVEGGRVRRSRS